ncbi:4Fe-4S dicluster domain-containing protein [Anaerobacillus sp. CMMVII]|uniref:4Fe-4S dicluster domain-containing protein n=1 Tax=Anaerobacillus sp. CMMVII TaxID=2755588 RepID=UPI0021B8126D|nr:4Fe-4S dicluster domain-containing protein [Anaerobacillus sp. CMMVII]MCT8137021.1 4Fe-4S dicluster domain-containing protein [Anaerobacillus sp. CMMVII]
MSVNLAEKFKLITLTVDDHCDLCEKCVNHCPTGALNIVNNDEGITLSHNVIQCIDCELCSDSCLYINRALQTCLYEGVVLPRVLKGAIPSEWKKGKNL